MGKDKNVLYLGNLRRDLHVTELKNNLLDLFCDFIGIEIDWNDIDIRKGKNAWFAFVDLHNEREASETLEELASWENRKNLRYNFLHIVPPLESLAVDYKKVKKVRKNKKDKSKDSNELVASGTTSKTVKSENKNDSGTKSGDQKNANQIKSKSKTSKSTSDTLVSNEQGCKEKPASKEAEKPTTKVEKPITKEIEKPKTKEVEKPTTKETEKPTTNEAEKPTTKETEKPTTKETEKPTTNEAEKPTTKETEKPTTKETEKPTTNEAEKPTTKETEKPTTKETEKPTTKETEKPTTKETEKPTTKGSHNQNDKNIAGPTSTAEQTQPKHYVEGQCLGNETRNIEFKLGGGNYHKKTLHEHVCKYACCFLNGSEGGQLLIGVQNDGLVTGLDIDRSREDECRLTIDNAMKTLNPAVFTDMYKVSFIPVTGDPDKENLKVIEITFKATESDVLYSTGGDVYIRRDGSIQGPLKGAEIQEWTKKRYQQDLKVLRDQIQKQEERLRLYEQRAAHKSSKVCMIL